MIDRTYSEFAPALISVRLGKQAFTAACDSVPTNTPQHQVLIATTYSPLSAKYTLLSDISVHGYRWNSIFIEI